MVSNDLFEVLKIVASCAILFVWFVRYDNIKKEFREYGFPSWFRDIVGNILDEEGLDKDRGSGYINVVPITKGKSEVS